MEILIVEDDGMISRTIKSGWPVPGDRLHAIASFRQCDRLINAAEIDRYDALIVDINLPDGDGLEILRRIRSSSNIPIVLISGMGSPDSRASALDIGADDYVMKPFSVRELQARVNRLISKKIKVDPPAPEVVKIGDITCHFRDRVLRHDSRSVALTELETRLLMELHKKRGRVSSKPFLSESACCKPYDARDKTVDVYICRLRKKLAQIDARSAGCVQTIRGIGYRLVDATL